MVPELEFGFLFVSFFFLVIHDDRLFRRMLQLSIGCFCLRETLPGFFSSHSTFRHMCSYASRILDDSMILQIDPTKNIVIEIISEEVNVSVQPVVMVMGLMRSASNCCSHPSCSVPYFRATESQQQKPSGCQGSK